MNKSDDRDLGASLASFMNHHKGPAARPKASSGDATVVTLDSVEASKQPKPSGPSGSGKSRRGGKRPGKGGSSLGDALQMMSDHEKYGKRDEVSFAGTVDSRNLAVADSQERSKSMLSKTKSGSRRPGAGEIQ